MKSEVPRRANMQLTDSEGHVGAGLPHKICYLQPLIQAQTALDSAKCDREIGMLPAHAATQNKVDLAVLKPRAVVDYWSVNIWMLGVGEIRIKPAELVLPDGETEM